MAGPPHVPCTGQQEPVQKAEAEAEGEGRAGRKAELPLCSWVRVLNSPEEYQARGPFLACPHPLLPSLEVEASQYLEQPQVFLTRQGGTDAFCLGLYWMLGHVPQFTSL